METNLFPDTEEQAEARKEAQMVSRAFALVECNVAPPLAWLLREALTVYNHKGLEFSVKDASQLIAKQRELFPEH